MTVIVAESRPISGRRTGQLGFGQSAQPSVNSGNVGFVELPCELFEQ